MPGGSDPGISNIATESRDFICEWAEKQEGKGYSEIKDAGVGPDWFDCSGLVQQSYKHGANLAIPRVAALQQAASSRISADQLAAADLVFFGNPAYHVMMYIGSGQCIEAPHTGAVVHTLALADTKPTNYGTFTHLLGDGKAKPVNPNPVLPGPLGAIETGLHGMEAVFSRIEMIAEKLVDPTWWGRVMTIGLGILLAGIAMALIYGGLQ